jgi:hypothetical protein
MSTIAKEHWLAQQKNKGIDDFSSYFCTTLMVMQHKILPTSSPLNKYGIKCKTQHVLSVFVLIRMHET